MRINERERDGRERDRYIYREREGDGGDMRSEREIHIERVR